MKLGQGGQKPLVLSGFWLVFPKAFQERPRALNGPFRGSRDY